MPKGAAAADYDEVWIAYLNQPPRRRSLRKLSVEFAVRYETLRCYAKDNGWAKRAKELDAKALAAAERKVARTHTERMTVFLQIVDDGLDDFLQRMQDRKVELDPNALVGLMKLAMVHAGEATERVEIHEVRKILVTWTEMALRRLPADEREPFLGDLKQELGSLLSPN